MVAQLFKLRWAAALADEEMNITENVPSPAMEVVVDGGGGVAHLEEDQPMIVVENDNVILQVVETLNFGREEGNESPVGQKLVKNFETAFEKIGELEGKLEEAQRDIDTLKDKIGATDEENQQLKEKLGLVEKESEMWKAKWGMSQAENNMLRQKVMESQANEIQLLKDHMDKQDAMGENICSEVRRLKKAVENEKWDRKSGETAIKKLVRDIMKAQATLLALIMHLFEDPMTKEALMALRNGQEGDDEPTSSTSSANQPSTSRSAAAGSSSPVIVEVVLGGGDTGEVSGEQIIEMSVD